MEKQPIVKQRTFDAVFDIVLKHPFVFAALFCLLLIPMGFAQVNHVDSDGILAEAVIFVLVTAALFLLGRPSKSLKVNIYLAAMSAAVIIVYSLLVDDNHNNALMMFVPALIIIIQLAVVMYFEKSLSVDRAVFLMIIIGVVLRYCYCLKYSSTEMQHDIGSFSGQHGHLSYINYWYENGLSLPDFDITTRWQFYHPPLHHMLMALGMDIFTFLGLDERWAQEAIQILPMIYSALSMVVCYRIFKLVKLEGAGLVAAMAVPCFYRTFIIFGGAYNNDMLCTLYNFVYPAYSALRRLGHDDKALRMDGRPRDSACFCMGVHQKYQKAAPLHRTVRGVRRGVRSARTMVGNTQRDRAGHFDHLCTRC